MNRLVDRTENLFDLQTFACRPTKPSFAATFLESKLLVARDLYYPEGSPSAATRLALQQERNYSSFFQSVATIQR